jgi:hypothetical protein
VTSPTMVPKDAADAAGADSCAWTIEPANAIDATAMAKPGRHFMTFSQLRNLTIFPLLPLRLERNRPDQDPLLTKPGHVQKV